METLIFVFSKQIKSFSMKINFKTFEVCYILAHRLKFYVFTEKKLKPTSNWVRNFCNLNKMLKE